MSFFTRSRSVAYSRRNSELVEQWARMASPRTSTSWEIDTGGGAGICSGVRGGPKSCEKGGSAMGPLVAPPPVRNSILVSVASSVTLIQGSIGCVPRPRMF